MTRNHFDACRSLIKRWAFLLALHQYGIHNPFMAGKRPGLTVDNPVNKAGPWINRRNTSAITDPVAKADMCCRMSALAKPLRYLRLL